MREGIDGIVLYQVLVLTKPLGTQVAVNAHQWINIPDRSEKIVAVKLQDIQLNVRTPEPGPVLARLRLRALVRYGYSISLIKFSTFEKHKYRYNVRSFRHVKILN